MYATNYQRDVRRVYKYYHAALGYIFNRPAGVIKQGRMCDICGHGDLRGSIRGYDICIHCRSASIDIYKHGAETPTTTRKSPPRRDILMALRNVACDAIAVLTQYTPLTRILATKYVGRNRCNACLSLTWTAYIAGPINVYLCPCCCERIDDHVSAYRNKNAIITAAINETYCEDIAALILDRCACVYAGHTITNS